MPPNSGLDFGCRDITDILHGVHNASGYAASRFQANSLGIAVPFCPDNNSGIVPFGTGST